MLRGVRIKEEEGRVGVREEVDERGEEKRERCGGGRGQRSKGELRPRKHGSIKEEGGGSEMQRRSGS